ncbi:MAG: glycosyltransferase, partial [Gemmatimonadaceae bacterium]
MARTLFVVSDALWTGRARALVSAARGLAARGGGHTALVIADPSSATHAEAMRSVEGGGGHFQGIQLLALPPRSRKGGAARLHALRVAIRDSEADAVFVHSDTDHLAVGLAMVGLRRKPALVRRIAVGERVRPTRVGRVAERFAGATHLLIGRPGIDRVEAESPRFRVELGVRVPDHVATEMAAATPLIACAYDVGATIHASRVLRAVTMLRKRHRQLTLCMIASADVPERLRMQAAALGLSRVVRWLSVPAQADELLPQAWALVVAVGGDDAVFATLDGMAHGVPIVAPRAALFERYVANGISGILLDSFDAPACAAALATLLSDAERRSAMGGAARARVARDYPESEYIAGLEALLRSIAST